MNSLYNYFLRRMRFQRNNKRKIGFDWFHPPLESCQHFTEQDSYSMLFKTIERDARLYVYYSTLDVAKPRRFSLTSQITSKPRPISSASIKFLPATENYLFKIHRRYTATISYKLQMYCITHSRLNL